MDAQFAYTRELTAEVERLRNDWAAEENGRLDAEAEAECYRQQASNADTSALELREALIPFAFIGRASMEALGLAEEYDHARALLGLTDA